MFTTKQIEKLIRGKDSTTAEKAPRGSGRLVLRVRNGTGEWLYQYFVDGKRKMMKLGNASGPSVLSLDEVREMARRLARELKDGLDPKVQKERREVQSKAEEKAAAERGTVEQLFREYVNNLKRRGKKSWPQVESALLTGQYAVAKEFGLETKAAEVSVIDVHRALNAAYRRGHSMAAHLRAYLSAAFKFGIGHEHDYTRVSQDVSFGLIVNPVASIPPDQDAQKAGDRVLKTEEIKGIWFKGTLHGLSEIVHAAVKLILATGGQRVREVVEARREEFDLDGRVWTIPKTRTKNNREHRVPLTKRAVEIVAWLMGNTPDSSYLIPNMRDVGRPADFAGLNQAVRRYSERAKVGRWTPRDIRRTARIMLAEAGEPDHRLDYHFNHGRSVGVGQKHYDRSTRLAEKMITMDAWDNILTLILDGDNRKNSVTPEVEDSSPFGPQE